MIQSWYTVQTSLGHIDRLRGRGYRAKARAAALMLLASLPILASFQAPVQSISDTIIDDSVGGANVFMEVTQTIGSLNAPNSWARLTYPAGTTPQINFYDMVYNRASGIDGSSTSYCVVGNDDSRCRTYFEVYQMRSDRSLIHLYGINSQTGRDGNGVQRITPVANGWTANHTVSGVNPAIRDDTGRISIVVQARWDTSPPFSRTNAFKIRAVNGRAGFFSRSTSGEQGLFAVQNRRDAFGSQGTFTLEFGVPCSVRSAQQVTLRWTDADHASAGGAPADSNVSFELQGRSFGGQWTRVDSLSTGNPVTDPGTLGGNLAERTATFTAQPNHDYRWIWRDIARENGVQFWLPFDSEYTAIDCGQTVEPTCQLLQSIWPQFPTNDHTAPLTAIGQTDVTLRLDALTGGPDIAQVRWDFDGDGRIDQTTDGANGPFWFTRTYAPRASSYTPTVSYTVTSGQTATCANQITVEDAPIQDTDPIGNLDSVSCSTITGWAFDPNRRGQPVEVEIQIGDSFRDRITTNVRRTAGGVNGEIGFSYTVPAQFVNANRYQVTAIAINAQGTPGANKQLSGSPKTLGPCTVTQQSNWDYQVGLVGSSDRTVEPGQVITLDATARNQGDGTGQSFTLAIDPEQSALAQATLTKREGGGDGFEGIWRSQPALTPGASNSKRAAYRVNDNAQAGTRICFQARVNPAAGATSPVPSISVQQRQTPAGAVCYEVVRAIYDYSIFIDQLPETVFPGQQFSVTSPVDNNNGTATGATYTHAIFAEEGDALVRNTDVQTANGGEVNGGTTTWTGQAGLADNAARSNTIVYTVRNDAINGEEICFRARVAPAKGYAGPGNNDVLIDERVTPRGYRCVTVSNLPYELNNPDIRAIRTGYVGQQFNATFTIDNLGVGRTTTTGDVGVVTVARTFGALSSGAPSQTLTEQIINGQSSWTDSVGLRIPLNAQPGDEFCISVAFTPTAGFEGGPITNPAAQTAEHCVTVEDFAYLDVYGAGVRAGGWFDSVARCTLHPAAEPDVEARRSSFSITSLLRGAIGSSVEYNALALSRVQDFGSGAGQNQPVIDGGESLTMANTPELGSYGANPDCIGDYYEELSNAAVISGDAASGLQAPFSEVSKVYRSTGSATLGLGENRFSGKSVVLVDGDVFIDQNIAYVDNYGSANALQIPSLVVIARGDIFIDQSVTRLDGLFIAIPRLGAGASATGGTIDTCTQSNQDRSNCNQQLRVNGGFIANYVNFDRTFGGYNAAFVDNAQGRTQSNFAAEIIDFSPELYLANPFDRILKSYSSDGRYDSLIELPPTF